jgi:hypothetical protein
LDVSVICPAFNTPASVLSAAIRSVLDQGGPHTVELILVNDCSTDPATIAALRDAVVGDDRVRVIDQPRNVGPAQARSAGIARATHGWIGFVDSDDLWPAGKLDQAAMVLGEWADTRWISGAFTTLLPGNALKPSRLLTEDCPSAEVGRTAQRLRPPDSTRAFVGAWHPLGCSLFHKDLIEAAGGFDPRLTYGEDWLLCLRASMLAPMDYVETATYVLRRQGSSLMHSPGRLSIEAVRGIRTARRDPALRSVRRELRWLCYGAYKDVAMNNALNGRKFKGLSFALRALALDPRELGEFSLFLRLLRASGPALADGLQRYSSAEQLDLSCTRKLD